MPFLEEDGPEATASGTVLKRRLGGRFCLRGTDDKLDLVRRLSPVTVNRTVPSAVASKPSLQSRLYLNSQNATAAAAATLSESTPPLIGIFTV